MKRVWLLIEFSLVFIGLPLLILEIKNRSLMAGLVWGGALLVAYILWRVYHRNFFALWNWGGFIKGLPRVLKHFAIGAPVLALIAWVMLPDQFLSMPFERTDLWLKIMLLYPMLSVLPQEIIYRSFMYTRYGPVFGHGSLFVVVSAAAFGFMHIMFLNPVAVGLCLAGGFLFAEHYRRHQSLALACFEHALYGCLVFTLGLGRYFYSGAAWS